MTDTLTFSASAYAQSNLYLSANDKQRDWRMTEILVAIVESFIQGNEVDTVSSLRIKDVIGDLEQLDVAQIRKLDPTKYFNFIEVRDRNSKVGRPYIQEIMGKRQSTAIQECKIVSTKGFTENAKRLASFENINLRLLKSDRTPQDQYWLRTKSTQLQLKQTRIDKCLLHVKINDDYADLVSEFPETSIKSLLRLDGKTSLVQEIPVLDLFNRAILSRVEVDQKIFSQIPIDGQYYQTDPITVNFDNPLLFIRVELDNAGKPFPDGAIYPPIHAIRFFVSSKITAYESKIRSRYNYIDAVSNNLIAQCALYDFNIGEKFYHQVYVRYDLGDEFVKVGTVFFE